MRQNLLLLIPVLLPIVAGFLVLTVKRIRGERKLMLGISLAALLAVLAVCTVIAFQPDGIIKIDLDDGLIFKIMREIRG